MFTLALIVCVLIVIGSVKLSKLYKQRQLTLNAVESIPGPPALPILGNTLDFKEGTTVVLPKLIEYTKEYGRTFKLLLGPHVNVFTSDPKFIELICTSKTQITKGYGYRFLHEWLGTGLLTATNPKWKAHRKLLMPAFHYKILENSVITFQENAENLIEHLKHYIGKTIDIHEKIVYSSLDIISETAMGFSINALKERNSSNYAKSLKYITKMLITRAFSLWRQIDILYKRSSEYKQERKCLEYLHNLTEKIIKAKRKELLDNQHLKNNKDAGKTFLGLLLRCSTEEGGALSDDDIRQEVDTFMFAGHDTVSAAISFSLYLLSTNKDEQEKCYKEICNILKSHESITMESLNEMKYLDMVIKESMRLYPPVPIIARELTEDITFDGQIYPKGITISIAQFITHRLPEFYDDPEKFIPERFNLDNSSTRDSYTYLPFSTGPRNCIGQKFAMLEMKSILSAFLHNFKIEASETPLNLAAETVLTSHTGVHIRLEAR